MPLPLSIFIICCNEVERIGRVLESVKDLSDDIVIVDSGSTDGTLDLVKIYTDRIYHKDWEGFGQQKVYAESLCRHDWILNLDADEIILESLKDSVVNLFQTPEETRAGAYSFRICHVSSLALELTPSRFCPVNITARLYDKRRAGFRDSAVHDKLVTFDGSKPVLLEGDVAHISLKSFSHMWSKIEVYSALQAQDWFEKGRKPNAIQMIYDPPLFFIKNYFLRRLCFVGVEGVMIAMALSAGRALRIAMTIEKWRKREKVI